MTARLRYSVAMSLDGFIAPPDGSIDWLSAYAGGADFEQFLRGIGGIVMGRDSFEQSLSLHEWDWDGRPVAVMTSRTLPDPPQDVASFNDPRAALVWLGERFTGGDIWLFGGGKTAGTFLAAGLIDQVELAVIPVLLGGGRRLFEGAGAASLDLLESTTAATGVQNLTYSVRAP